MFLHTYPFNELQLSYLFRLIVSGRALDLNFLCLDEANPIASDFIPSAAAIPGGQGAFIILLYSGRIVYLLILLGWEGSELVRHPSCLT